MNYKKYLWSSAFILFSAFFVQGQTKTVIKSAPETVIAVKSSAAYVEILLKRTELEAELEDLLIAYTTEYPRVKEIQFQLGVIKEATDKLFALNSSETQNLTTALGKLIVRKMEHETELWHLQKKYSDDHPEVKKAKRKILVYESAIKDVIL